MDSLKGRWGRARLAFINPHGYIARGLMAPDWGYDAADIGAGGER